MLLPLSQAPVTVPPAPRWPLPSEPARVQFEGVALPGLVLDFEARAGEIVHLAGGAPMVQLRALAIASAFAFKGAGRCRLFGLDVMSLRPDQRLQLRQQQIGRVLQTDELPAGLPLLAGVAQPGLRRGLSAHEALHRAAEELDGVGLGEQQSLPPDALDAGALRLALIARALLLRPRLLLLERPELGLDNVALTTLQLVLAAIAADGGCIVMTSANPWLAATAHRRVSLDVPVGARP